MLLDTGLRAGELASLRLEDIDFDHQRIHVRHGKGNKQRVVRFGHEAGQALRHYLERFRGTGPGPLFLTCHGRPLRTSIGIIFRRLGREASLAKVHPHRFRHTFATWAIEQQAREIDVQYLLGHSTPAMLRRYTAAYDAKKAAQAHALFSPADRLKARLEDEPRRVENPDFPEAALNFPRSYGLRSPKLRIPAASYRWQKDGKQPGLFETAFRPAGSENVAVGDPEGIRDL